MLHVWSNTSNKIDIFIGKIAHTVRMFRHGEMLSLPHARRIVQHREMTRRGNSAFPFHFVFRIRSCVFSFRAHISSWSKTQDTTLIRGLNHGWNRTIVVMKLSVRCCLMCGSELRDDAVRTQERALPQQFLKCNICLDTCQRTSHESHSWLSSQLIARVRVRHSDSNALQHHSCLQNWQHLVNSQQQLDSLVACSCIFVVADGQSNQQKTMVWHLGTNLAS